ncbi:MAG: cbb3-type cytochrome c oxidase subunit I [Rhodocyclaceae bacterium]|nr:cbb3-type cytochrome c oxidase subunit I [Rhodocyclaceae bacterium]
MAVAGTFAIFGGVYYWFPKMSGRMYNELWGKIGFWVTFVGVNIVFWTMMDIGARIGLPRRYYDYAQFPEAASAQHLMTIGAAILGVGFVIALLNWIIGAAKGPKAGDNPWGSPSLEWSTVSPPPHGNWPSPPSVSEEWSPYAHGRR